MKPEKTGTPMTFKPIETFGDVILYELQQSKDNARPSKTFSQIWASLLNAEPNLPGHTDSIIDSKNFNKKLFLYLDQLENQGTIVITRNNAKQVVSVKLTKNGYIEVSSIIFTHQNRLRHT